MFTIEELLEEINQQENYVQISINGNLVNCIDMYETECIVNYENGGVQSFGYRDTVNFKFVK